MSKLTLKLVLIDAVGDNQEELIWCGYNPSNARYVGPWDEQQCRHPAPFNPWSKANPAITNSQAVYDDRKATENEIQVAIDELEQTLDV
jgi:hypothetical protein